MWHLNGHEPLCTYICDFKSPGVGKDFEQRLHLCGFSYNEKQTKIAMLVPYFFVIRLRLLCCGRHSRRFMSRKLWWNHSDDCICYNIFRRFVLLVWIWFEYLSLVTQFLIKSVRREGKREAKQKPMMKKITRMKIFPFDLHKYDNALIVLVIWFHDLTLALIGDECWFFLRFSFLSS